MAVELSLDWSQVGGGKEAAMAGPAAPVEHQNSGGALPLASRKAHILDAG